MADKEIKLDQTWAYAPRSTRESSRTSTPTWLLRRKSVKKPTIEIDAQALVEWHEDYYKSTWEQAERMAVDWVRNNLQYPIPAQTTYGYGVSMRELLKLIQLRHLGSPVWWTDLDTGPVEAATLYDLTQGYGSGPKQMFHLKGHPHTYMVTLDQWDRAEYPAPSEGGPPYVKGVSVAREAKMASEKYVDPTFKEVVAPQGNIPEWLIAGRVDERYNKAGSALQFPTVRVSIPEENEDFIDERGSYTAWADFVDSLLNYSVPYVLKQYQHAEDLRRPQERYLNRPQKEALKTLETGLGAIDIFYGDSPVWWVHLDDGPLQAATLMDLATAKQPAVLYGGKIVTAKNGNLWLMSLDQWDNAEYPPESLGGPPYVKGVSVAQEDVCRDCGGNVRHETSRRRR